MFKGTLTGGVGGSWIAAIFDEIALEGLDGCTLPWLWTLLSIRLECGPQLSEKLQQQIWTLLLRSIDKVSFYQLKEERPLLPPYRRSDDMDTEINNPLVPKTCPIVRLPYGPIKDGPIMGNCFDYRTRQRVDVKELQGMTASEATQHWHQTLVVVASQELRSMALQPSNAVMPKSLPIQQYVFLENVGRSRYNGETTGGPWSAMYHFKDSSFIFYMKNRLRTLRLVTSQPYVERLPTRTICSSLVMLPRFQKIYKTHMQRVLEKLYMVIKVRPERYIPIAEIPDVLDELTSGQTKKLLISHGLRRVYESTQVMQPSKQTGKMRKVTVLRLRNPDLKFDEIMQHDSNDGKEDKSTAEFLNQSRAYVDMPLELECLRAVARSGTRGMSTIEVAQYVAANIHAVRGCLKYLQRVEEIKSFTESEGKTRITRFVAGTEAAADMAQKQKQIAAQSQMLQCQEEPTVPSHVDIVLNDLPEITANMRHFTFPPAVKSEKQSQRLLDRKILIVRQVNERSIVHFTDLIKVLNEMDYYVNSQESICRKTLFRMLHKMQTAGIINAYELTLKYEQRLRIYRLVTHPKIDMEHDLMRREVLRLKSNFHLISEEQLRRPSQLNSMKKNKDILPRKKLSTSAKGIPKPTSPKLLLACILHEFFFYLVYEQQRDQKPLPMSAELLQHWQNTEPSLQTRQYLEEWQTNESHVLPYTDEISWRTFLQPLPSYEDKPPGWFYFMDALERMPLSLMQRMFRVERDGTEQLRPHLLHQVRQHYQLRQLNLQLLIPRLRQQQIYIGTLRLLNNMGLIQVSERQQGRDPLQRWVYLNQRSCLLDTTTSSGHNYNRISAGRKYEELQFEFATREHVTDYWAKLQHVCIYTKLGFMKHREPSKGKKARVRLPQLTFVRKVDFDEAEALDNGSVPGDRQGAAGLSSLLFAHQFRHWSWVKRTIATTKRSILPNAVGKTVNVMPVRKRMNRLRLKPVEKLRRARGVNACARRKSGPRDDVDRDALRNMRTLRVTWTAAEDRLLKMGRAVYLFIDAPLPALALCNVGTVCRDVIRQYLGICNKTTQACVRRLQFLIRQKRDQPDVPNWIYAIQTQPKICAIYNENFLAEIKREYPVRSEQNEALLVHFVLILSMLHRMVSSADTVRRQFTLPDYMEDYQQQFRECGPLNADADQVLFANPTTETELQVNIALGVLHSILCSAKDKTLFNLQAFEIYKNFSEDVLSAAFNKARMDSLLVAMKRRNIHPVSRQVTGPSHLLSAKYKSRLFCQKLGHLLYDTYHRFEKQLQEQRAENKLQLSSPNFAQLLLMGEWMAKDRLQLSLQLPANILTVDTWSMSQPGSSSTDRILDHYSSIFDNAPQTEYSKRLESECSARQAARVRFHPANLTYRLQCGVYNQLSKLPLRAMHFFCALDSIGQSVNISCARLEQGECPFATCIMRSGNYLNAVERISYEHRPLLKQLIADALPPATSQLQLPLDGSSSVAGSTTLTVSATNWLSLVQQLETYWRQQQHQQECKDVGKALAERTLHKLTDWRSLCTGLLEFEAGKEEVERTQDYEPSLNKEERARAQDVFVVHLPTIQLHMEKNDQQQQAKEAQLHKSLLEKVINSSFWRYTENSFETLLPQLQAKDYDANAIQHIKEILEYIEQHPLGVVGLELRRIFPFNKLLLEMLHQLEAHDLIKRVGIASHMYVHKLHMRHWVVHTFHITRLERERIQPQVAAVSAMPQVAFAKKRKASAGEQDTEQPTSSKQAKLTLEPLPVSSEDSSDYELPSRSSKRIRANINKQQSPSTAQPATDEFAREVIVMRPQPWIRANASLNRRVLDRWLGALLSECISRTGCTVYSLFLRFPHLQPVDIMLLMELLCHLDCIHLMELETPTVHIESSYDDDLKEEQVSELYDPSCTYVTAHCNAIGSLTRFIGTKKYSNEFI
ncbi:general transcription factor 3C polypeptide 1 [Drosophila sulfurigaster albostrigata]|uniref:general transcription factor 3C polypeptide 1 n=1 Tax=Drosophila sulfurigaster albostrigata TaxID=89887 RepID=UPI002D21E50C|nr:general transcription factor 3C polypeptide 1 [Drosophila sulfurigaster albostrigata]